MGSETTGALPSPQLLAMLDVDRQGWAFARSVRDAGRIVDFELLYINEPGARMLGRAKCEMQGRWYRDLWPETMHDGTLPVYRNVVERGEPLVRTVYYERTSVTGHFEVRVAPYGDGFVSRFVDLSQLTLGQPSEGGARLYEVLDAAFDGLTLMRAVRDEGGAVVDFVIEYVNQIGAKLVERSVEEVINHRLLDLAPNSRMFHRYREVLQHGRTSQQQVSSADGSQVWEIKINRIGTSRVASSFREVTAQLNQREQVERIAAQVRTAADRTAALQAVTAALVRASTTHEVYAAMGSVVRPSAGGHGIVVLLREADRLLLAYQAGYEPDVVDQLRALPLTHQYPATEVARTGQPRYLSSPAQFTAAQPDGRNAVSGGGRQAWAFLPLATAGQVLGALVIGYAEPRSFSEEEQANLTAFSRLAAQALQRARLFEAQSSIAADLQRALLPSVLPQLPGARHATRYLPWTHGADVGGDWYDLIPLGPDVAAVVIGDVVGHNTQAAATMGQLRNALRAYAAEGHSPTGVMNRVNELLLRLEPDAVATCCYLELHLGEGTATAVLAGHPPPVLRAGGAAAVQRLRSGPPLGVTEDVAYVDSSFLLPPGCSLLLYTDGLVEDRRYTIDQGLADLCAAVLAAPSPDPEILVDHILSADVGPYPRSDDVALLALTIDAPQRPGPRRAERHFRGDAASASAARRLAADILTAWRQQPLIDDACLLLDEVITNAVQHTVGDVRVLMTLDQRLRIEVHDSSERRPDIRPTSADSETGRGLQIVDRLAADWGHEPLPGSGKVVWFELESATG